MKKLIAIIVSVAMILSVSVLMVNAVEMVNGDGKILIEWDADAADKITFDGDISEWDENGYTYTKITGESMWAWDKVMVNPDPDFAINAYFVADPDYLYVAFWINDSDWVKAVDDDGTKQAKGAYGNADAFQIAIDYNGFMEYNLENAITDYGNNKSIFYSFACYEEGADLIFKKEEGYDNRALSEENGDDVMGVADAFDGGWCAEFALGWDQMYQDLTLKTMEDYAAPFDADNDFKLGVLLCYLNHDNTDNNSDGKPDRTWMAGTTKNNNIDWMPTDSGIYLTLEWEEGRYLNTVGADNGYLPDNGETDPVTTEPVTTEPVTTEPVTTEPVTTEPVTTEPVTTEPVTTEPVTTEPVTTEPVTTEPATSEEQSSEEPVESTEEAPPSP